MDVKTVKAKMDQQVADVLKVARPFLWKIQKNEIAIFVEMRHRRKPDQPYFLKVSFEDYPKRAPSYVFVDMATKNPGGWPPNVKHGSNPPGICTPGTRECIEHYHKGDAQYQWDPNKNNLRSVLMEIQKMLEKGIGG